MGSQYAAGMMLTAVEMGSPDDVRITLASLNKLIPEGSPASEWERRDLLEGLGAEVIAHRTATSACRSLLEHLAGTHADLCRQAC